MSGVHPGLVVGIPFCGRPVMPEWALSLATQNWPMGMNIMYVSLKGVETGLARNRIVEQALEHKAKYVWFIDDDTAPQHFAIKKLVRVLEENPDVMVCGGIYCSRHGDDLAEPIVFKRVGEGVHWHWKVGDVFECEAIGTGCMLIRTEIFDKIEKPWFQTVDEDCSQRDGITAEKQTDDIYFCKKVIDAGYKIMAHGGVLPVHWDSDSSIPYVLPEDSYPLRNEEIEKALKIRGWMTKTELTWLASEAKKHKDIAELGSFMGRSTRALGDNTSGTVLAIDNWNGPQEMTSFPLDSQTIYAGFVENLKDLIATGKVVPWTQNHEEAFPKCRFDMIFIDGAHDYNSVVRDISRWKEAIFPGGLICGHDSDMEAVSQAVIDTLPDATVVPGTKIWYYEVPKTLTIDQWKNNLTTLEKKKEYATS